MDRKPLIAGAVLLVVLMILCIFGSSLLLNQWKSRQGRVDHRDPLPGLGYCSSRQVKPCILSFNLNPDGGMVINIVADGSSQDFYVKVKHEAGEHIYECKRARRYSINISCTGETMPVGETLSFLLISTEENTTLAEGSFPIIGMALATPEIYITPTYVPVFDRPPR